MRVADRRMPRFFSILPLLLTRRYRRRPTQPRLRSRALSTIFVTVAIVAAATAAGAGARGAGEPETLILANATLVDGTGAPPVPGVTLVVRDGLIARITRESLPESPAGAEVVDLSGRFLVPGLIDAHVHLSNNPDPRGALRRLLDAGVIVVRDMGGDASALAVLTREAASGAIRSPDVHYSALLFGPPFLQDPRSRFSAGEMEPGHAPWSRVVSADTDVSRVIAEARETGATGVKLYSAIEPALLQRIVEEAQRRGLKVWSHATIFPSKPSDAVAAGVDVLSHSSGLFPEARSDVPGSFTEAIRTWFPEQDFAAVDPFAEPFDALFAAMVREGVMLEPTVAAGRQPRTGIGREGQQEHLARAAARMDLAARRQWTCDVTRAAHEAGVDLVAGTDSNGSGDVILEMEVLVECGLSPLDAIRAGTLNGARAIGIDATHGSVEIGKTADLLIVAVDPTAVVGNLREVVTVVRSGRIVRRGH